MIQALLNRGEEAICIKSEETRSFHAVQRSQLLMAAVDTNNPETVWLLASQASPSRLKRALNHAIDHNLDISKKLLQYGADPNACKSQFIAACSLRDQHIVSHLLSAPISIKHETPLQALTVAVEA